jgi:hypothetical protein
MHSDIRVINVEFGPKLSVNENGFKYEIFLYIYIYIYTFVYVLWQLLLLCTAAPPNLALC